MGHGTRGRVANGVLGRPTRTQHVAKLTKKQDGCSIATRSSPLDGCTSSTRTSRPRTTRIPHPDFLQVVLVSTATESDASRNELWIDTEGYEQGSRLATPREALAIARGSDLMVAPFLELVGES